MTTAVKSITLGSLEEKSYQVQEPIFRNILSFLDWKSLNRCLAVCKEWKEPGKKQIKALITQALRESKEQPTKYYFFLNFFRTSPMKDIFEAKNELDSFLKKEEKHKKELIYEVLKVTKVGSGLSALFELYKADLITTEELEDYVKKCQGGYSNLNVKYAQVFILKGRLDLAKEFLKSYERKPELISDLVIKIITLECEKNQLEAAFETLKAFRKKINHGTGDKVIDLILEYAKKNNDVSLTNRLLDMKKTILKWSPLAIWSPS